MKLKYKRMGYELSPYQSRDYNNENPVLIRFNESFVKKIARREINIVDTLVTYKNHKSIYVKYDKKIIPVNVNDFIKGLESFSKENIDRDEFLTYICFFFTNDLSSYKHLAVSNTKKFVSDLYYEDDAHIVYDLCLYLHDILKFKNIDEVIFDVLDLAYDAIRYRKDKKPGTSIILLLNTISKMTHLEGYIPEEVKTFYVTNLQKEAKKNNPLALKILGEEYYDGSTCFPHDDKKSEKYLLKAFELTSSPQIADSLGYIYYYGRTTNGVVQGEKAFQYFSIAANDGIEEAICKLADCFEHGIGVPSSPRCAYNLVRDGFAKAIDDLLFDLGNDVPDFARRLGHYAVNGIGREKALDDGYIEYQFAKWAIKDRILFSQKIGDYTVARKIFDDIYNLEIKENINIKRKIKFGGYVIAPKENVVMLQTSDDFEVCLDDYGLHITYRDNGIKKLFFILYGLSYVEVSQEAHLLLTGTFDDASIEEKNFTSFCLDRDAREIELTYDDEQTLSLKYDQLIYVPQTIKEIKPIYNLCKIKFDETDNIYFYLYDLKDLNVGDRVKVYSDEIKEAKVVEIYPKLYEDQLPLPLSKLTNIIEKVNKE